MSVIVITGAAGLIGSMLRPRLARPDRTLGLTISTASAVLAGEGIPTWCSPPRFGGARRPVR